MSNSQNEYNSNGSQVDDVHISNDLSSLILFGETISPIARANFYESVATKLSSKKENTNSERKLRRDSKGNYNHFISTRYEPILRVSNYGSQSSPFSKQSSRKSSVNIVRSYSTRTPFSCCCCCWYLRCRCCCCRCRWNLFRFERDRFGRYSTEQNFRPQNKVLKKNFLCFQL